MEGELLWLFHDDVFPSWIPPNHVMVFCPFKESVEFCEKGSLRLRMARLVGFWSGGLVWLFLRMFVIRGDRARMGLGWLRLLLLLLLLVLLG
jgi:hypothetical protein